MHAFIGVDCCCAVYDDKTDGMFLIELDRLLKPGGYVVLTSPTIKQYEGLSPKKRNMLTPMEELTEKICWSLIAQQEQTFIWQKTSDVSCYSSR